MNVEQAQKKTYNRKEWENTYIYIYMVKLSLGIFGIFGYSNKVSALAFPSVHRPDV